MTTIQTKVLPRDQIAQFMPTPRAIIAFEALQQDTTNQYSVLVTGQFLTLDSEPALGAERVFTPIAGDLIGTDNGTNSPYTLSLAPTGVASGPYGGASYTTALSVDAKGRLTSATAYALNTANVAEGTNLYYTDARARAALSAGPGVGYNPSTGAISLATSGVTAGTYTFGTHTVVVDGYGRITSIT